MATINLEDWAAPLAGLPVDVQIALWKQLAGRSINPSTVYQQPFLCSTAAIAPAAGGNATGAWNFDTVTCIYGISGVQTTAAVARALQGMQIQTRNGAWPWLGTATQPLNMGGIPDISLGAQDYLAVAPTVALMNEAWNCVITNNDVAASQVFMYLRGVQLFTPGGGF
jgi:hypothetical protein